MSLNFPNTPAAQIPQDAAIKSSSPFWPEISPDTARKEMRIDNTITVPRLRHCLIEAVLFVNNQLKEYRIKAQQSGFACLGDASDPDEAVDGIPASVFFYCRAVMCYAKGNLVENYGDYDSTGKPPQNQQEVANNYERDGHAAIADILGINRVRAELV